MRFPHLLDEYVWKDSVMKFRKIPGSESLVRKENGSGILDIDPGAIEILAREAFTDINFCLSRRQIADFVKTLSDPDISSNESFVVSSLLENARIASARMLPLCQDTGTATVFGWKGESVRTGSTDSEALSRGIEAAYREGNLRFSQLSPLSIFEEEDTLNNLPAQIELSTVSGDEYRFAFVAKGGGSSNKTSFYPETKALLNEKAFSDFLKKRIESLGVAACPPYHIGVVVGGTSPEANLRALKLATAGFLDSLPAKPEPPGSPFRVPEWEERVMEYAKASGLGAQFGGSALALGAIVIRLSRHAASCPVSIGVSCSAHRNARGKISEGGIFLEELERDPGRLSPEKRGADLDRRNEERQEGGGRDFPVKIDVDLPMAELRRSLSSLPLGAMMLLSGTLIVARDAAHARFAQGLSEGKGLPPYLFDHPIIYAGPAETPAGLPIGAFGPTTAGRMDSYADSFMAEGASLVSIAKGNRSAAFAQACARHGGFYLGTLGGAAAFLAERTVLSSEVIDFHELGMEAVRKIRVRDLPAFILVNDKGGDFYANIASRKR